MSTMRRVCFVFSLLLPLLGQCATGSTNTTTELEELKKMKLVELMNIEVTTVTRTESTVGESATAVFVITSEMIRRSGATTIPELLRMVPGLDVARVDNNKWAVNARGFNARFAGNLLVQIDGRTVYTPIFSGVYWDTVDYPLEDIERIEVIRGPGASVWGANAVNGVINIITKSSQRTQGGRASVGSGSKERSFGEFRYGGYLANNLSCRVYGKGFDRGKQSAAHENPQDGWEGDSGGLRLDWKPTVSDEVTFDGGYLRSEAGRRDLRPLPAAPYLFTNIETEVSDAAHALVRWAHQISPGNNWQVQAYWDQVERVGDQGYIGIRWDTYDVDFQHQFTLGERHKFVYGLGYRALDVAPSDSQSDDGFQLHYAERHTLLNYVSAFVQDQFELEPNTLSVLFGSKFEHNDLSGFDVQPTARLLWTPTPRQSAWAAVSRAIRTPNYLEDQGATRTLTAPGAPSFLQISPNTELDAEKVCAYEIGYRIQTTPQLSVDMAAFYNVYDDLIGTRPGAIETNGLVTVRPQNRENTLHGETYGAEVGSTWQVADRWRLYGAYTFLELQLHRASGLRPTAEAAEGQSPANQLYLQSSWDLPGHTEFDLIGRYVGHLSGFNPSGAPGVSNTIDAYWSLDARLGWRPSKNWELAIVGQNLLDNHHPEFGTSPLIRSPLVNIERSVYGKVTYWW